MKLYKGYWYFIHFENEYKFYPLKTRSKELAYKKAREQPIYIEPSESITDVRDRALPIVYQWRDDVARSTQNIAKGNARFVKEVKD